MTEGTFALFAIEAGSIQWLMAGSHEQALEACADAAEDMSSKNGARLDPTKPIPDDAEPTFEFLFVVPVAHFVSNV